MPHKTLMIMAFLILTGVPVPALARQTCDELWYARNEIYKAQGYCFRTQRGIAAFGNAGCQHDNAEDLPLSNTQRRMIADIQREERARRCPR